MYRDPDTDWKLARDERDNPDLLLSTPFHQWAAKQPNHVSYADYQKAHAK